LSGRAARSQRFGDAGYQLHYRLGRDGVMGELEPLSHQPGHELCIVVQATRPRSWLRQMFHARLPR
jgi:hypothetical protein